jgi:hypothetical protein
MLRRVSVRTRATQRNIAEDAILQYPMKFAASWKKLFNTAAVTHSCFFEFCMHDIAAGKEDNPAASQETAGRLLWVHSKDSHDPPRYFYSDLFNCLSLWNLKS